MSLSVRVIFNSTGTSRRSRTRSRRSLTTSEVKGELYPLPPPKPPPPALDGLLAALVLPPADPAPAPPPLFAPPPPREVLLPALPARRIAALSSLRPFAELRLSSGLYTHTPAKPSRAVDGTAVGVELGGGASFEPSRAWSAPADAPLTSSAKPVRSVARRR